MRAGGTHLSSEQGATLLREAEAAARQTDRTALDDPRMATEPNRAGDQRVMEDTPERKQHRSAIKAERFKMLAGGTQLIAVGVLSAFIAPTFNSARQFSLLLAAGGGITAALIEFAAWLLMGYGAPRVETDEEDADG